MVDPRVGAVMIAGTGRGDALAGPGRPVGSTVEARLSAVDGPRSGRWVR
jgi:hypothetical protein